MADTLLLISGALRRGSYNRLLMAEAARLFPEPVAPVVADLRLPLYDGDIEDAEGIPEVVARLAGQIAEARAVVIASPEYNKAFSGVLKNALDWVSRTKPNPWRDKPVAIVSAAAGREGGARGQFALRLALTPFHPRLITGPEVLVADAQNEFDAEGHLVRESYRKSLTKLMEKLAAM